MGCNSCNRNPCGCNVIPIPYYEDPCFQANQSECCTIFNQFSPVIRISTQWAVPEADEIITLKVSALADMLVGATISNPTYGDFEVVYYDPEGQLIKVVKEEYNDSVVGTTIPSCTKFLVTSTGILNETLAEIEAELVVIEAQILSLQTSVSTIQGDITVIEGDITAIEGDITVIEGDITAIEGDVSTLQGEVLILQGDVTTLQGEVLTLQGEVSTLQSEMNAVEASIDDLNLGWTDLTESWTYLSSTTVTVPTGAASRFGIGDKVSLTNNTGKYFYITAIADTVLTLNGGSDYTVANAAISAIRVSRAETPIGFPARFNWNPTPVGFSVVPSGAFYKFTIKGRKVFIAVYMPNNGTSDSTSFSIPAPVDCSTSDAGMIWYNALAVVTNNGSIETSVNGWAQISAAAPTSIVLGRNGSSTGWTAALGKSAWFELAYDI